MSDKIPDTIYVEGDMNKECAKLARLSYSCPTRISGTFGHRVITEIDVNGQDVCILADVYLYKDEYSQRT